MRFLSVLASLAVLVLSSTAVAQEDFSRKTKNVIANAAELLAEKDYETALEEIDGRLDDRSLSDLDKSALLMARSQILTAKDDLVSAEADARAALALDIPDWRKDELTVWLVFVLQEQDRDNEALTVLRDYSATYGTSDDIQALILKLEIDTGAKIPTDLPDRPMKPISTRAPSFPAGCARGASEYKVSVVFDVTATGDPVNIRILDSTDPCLAPAAMTTVSSWRFDPAVQSGYFVITRDVPVTVTFTAG